MTRFGHTIFASLVCAALTAPALLAQLGTATISGTVTDSSGAMVVGASVTAVSKETGFRRETVANNQGQYSMPGVTPGTYDVTFEFHGFKKSESKGLTLQVDQNARIDAVLEVGQVSESVEIKGQAPLIESQNASLGAVIDTEKILALPLNGRNFSQLALLVPGVTTGTGGFSANGLRSDQNAFQIDGTANSDSLQNGMAFQPNVDSVAEFKIQTSNYSAEFGKGAGAQVNIVTKSGTKGFHGTLWEFLRHDKVQARRSTDSNSRSFPCNRSDPDITGRKACAPPFKQNQFGFTLGGPMFFIPKGSGERKTFYFVTYEGFRQVRGAATITQVPTVAQRNGDFTQNLLTTNAGTDALGRQWRRGQIFDPLSSRQVRDSAGNLRFVRDAFTGNIIPKSRFDPVAAKIIANTNFLPLPNAPGIAVANGNTNENWLDGRSNLSNSDEFSNRVDHQFTPNDTVFGRFNFFDSNTYSPGSFVGFGTTNNTRNLNMTLSYTKVLTPSVINELRFGYTGRFSANGAEDGIAGTDWIGQFGIRGLKEARDSGILGSPSIAITGFAGLGNGTGPTTQRNYQFQPVEILSFNKGRHFMKVGGELRAARQNMVRPDAARGTFTFSTTNWTGIDGVANTGHTLSSFLLGLSAQKRRLVSDFLLQFRFAEWGAFFQDDYKATRNLTLNFGVRYMYYTPPYDARDAFSSFIRPLDCPNFASCSVVYNNFNPSNPNNPYFGLAGKDLPRSLTGTDKKNIGPRFGFAWQPFGSAKSVIRGGYGIFYDTVQTSINADSLWNYPQVVEDQQDLALGQNGLPSVEGFIGFATETPALTKPVAAFAPGPNNFHHDFHNAYIQSWNFTIQRQLPSSMVIEVAYVGNKGTRLQRQENTNTAEPLGPRSEIPDLTNNAAIRSDVGVGRNQFRRLFPYAVAEGVIIPLSNSFEETSSAFSNYHGANIRFEKKQSGGLSFITTYTFGKAMSDSPGFGGGGSGQAGRIQNILNKKLEKGLADLNHKHRFTVASVWELPFGKGRRWGSTWNGILDRVAGGWAIEGIVTYQTGLPVTIYRAGDPASMGASAILRPDIVKDCNPNLPGGEQTIARFFDTSCYAKPEQLISGDLRYGTAGRGTLQGPLTTGNDLSARKIIPITEKIRTEFRAEFFDAVNHAGFSVPTRDIDNGSFGRTTKTGDSRIIQFGLKLLF